MQQADLFTEQESSLRAKLLEVPVEALTPLQALQKLADLQKIAANGNPFADRKLKE